MFGCHAYHVEAELAVLMARDANRNISHHTSPGRKLDRTIVFFRFSSHRVSDDFSDSKYTSQRTTFCQVWEALGCNLATGPIAAMVLHLSIGDTWNHINNVEKKLGVAVSVVFVVVSKPRRVILSYHLAVTQLPRNCRKTSPFGWHFLSPC